MKNHRADSWRAHLLVKLPTAVAFVLGCLITMFIITGPGCALNSPKVKYAEKQTEKPSDYESPLYYFSRAQFEIINNDIENAIEHLSMAAALDPDSLYLKKELATLYLHIDDSDNAFRIMEEILARQPDDIETLIIYGKMHQIAGLNGKAANIYSRIINLDPKQKNIYLLLGGLLIDDNDLYNAQAVYQALVQQFPEFYIGHFYLGKVYAAQHHFFLSERELLKTIQLKPEIIEARFELIDLYQSAEAPGHYSSKIISAFREILEIDPENIRAAFEFALFLEQKGLMDQAESIFIDLAKQCRESQKVFRKIVQLYFEPRHYQKASILLENILSHTPDQFAPYVSELHYMAGMAFNEINDLTKAIEHFKQVSSQSAFYQKAAVHIAFLYQDQHRMADAIAFLENIVQELPESAELVFYLGALYEENDDYQKAETLFRQALVLTPDDTELLFRLGVVYDKMGDKQRSIEQMQKVIQIEPDNFNALNYVGYTYADLGINLDEAERLILEALKYKPDDAYIIDSLGWVYFKKGDYQKALIYLEKAVRLIEGKDAVLLEHLGDIYLKLNRKRNAVELYQRALNLDETTTNHELENKIRDLIE